MPAWTMGADSTRVIVSGHWPGGSPDNTKRILHRYERASNTEQGASAEDNTRPSEYSPSVDDRPAWPHLAPFCQSQAPIGAELVRGPSVQLPRRSFLHHANNELDL